MIATTLITLVIQAGILTLIVKQGQAQRRNRKADQKAVAAAITKLTEQFDEKLLQVYMTDEERAKYGLPTIGGALAALPEPTASPYKVAHSGPHTWTARYREKPQTPINDALTDTDGKAFIKHCVECEVRKVWDDTDKQWVDD